MGKKQEITAGRRYGRLTIQTEAKRDGKCRAMLCLCDCGSMATVRLIRLTSGKTRSCGCLALELTKKRATKHGQTKDGKFGTTYQIWNGMVQRCTNPNVKAFPNYGGRGIKVCDRWREFSNFLADMGERPQGMTLDRVNNNGDYTLENCRWASRKTQARNSRRARLVTLNGQTLCVSEWSEITGIAQSAIIARLNRGWSASRALEQSK